MTEWAQGFLEWTIAHPGWALFILFAAAALDAVFIVGVVVPAGPVLFAIGALVALDALQFWPAVLVATLGALSGDGFSFWLGRRFGGRLFESRWLKKRRNVIEGAQLFFDRHGGKGILIGRFLGPLRAVLAAVAGASGMRMWQFVLVDTVAAFLWAIAFILPGVIFGASLSLAAEVAGRLALLIALLAGLVWAAFTLTRIGLLSGSRYAERVLGRLLDLSRRYRRIGYFGAALADPKQPETPVLGVLALLLWVIGALSLFLIAAPWLHAYPWPTDAAVYQWLRDLHTPYGKAIASALLHLGEWPVYGPIALVMLLSLLLQRRGRAAAHWIAAVGFGGVLSVGLSLVPTLPAPFAYFGHATPPGYSERDLVLAIIIYAFIPVLLSTHRPNHWRRVYYGVSAAIIALVVTARLYVGAQWWSHALIDVGIALVWTALLGLGFRRHRPTAVAPLATLPPLIGALIIAGSVQWALDMDAAAPPPPAPIRGELTSALWRESGFRDFPQRRIDSAGRNTLPLNLQWAGELDAIRAGLHADGWTPTAALGGGQTLRWLSGSAPIALLPVLPQIHGGERPVLTLRREIDDAHQLAVRLWSSGVRLADGTPLWLGTLVKQEARSAFGGLMRYPVARAVISPDAVLDFAAPAATTVSGLYLLRTPPALPEPPSEREE